MEAFGDRIAYAMTMNEPKLARLLVWVNLPDFVRELGRGDARSGQRAAGVERYRVANVVVPEEFDAMQAGLTAGHREAKAAIKAQRSELPVGVSIAMSDDRVVGDDRRCATASGQRRTTTGWRSPPRMTSSACRTTNVVWYDANGEVDTNSDVAEERDGLGRRPSLAGRCRSLCVRPGRRAGHRHRARHLDP